MIKKYNKAIALILAFASIFSVVFVSASAQTIQPNTLADTFECTDGSCDFTPSIIVHGITQSKVYVKDDYGNYITDAKGKRIQPFPPSVDVNALMPKLLLPVLGTLFFQRDFRLTSAVKDALLEAFKYCETGLDGNPVHNLELERYPSSLANIPKDQKNWVMSQIPISDYAKIAGENHTYYFAYNSLGNVLDIADELAEYIEMVKAETGHDKVNLVFISLGGAIATAFLDTHKESYDSLEKIVFIIPAADGTHLVADIFKGEFNYADDMLYSEILPSIIDGYQGYLLNLVLRILPKNVLIGVLETAVETLRNLLKTCPNFWALVPSDEYEALADDFLAGEDYEYLRGRTDRYNEAQLNLRDNITELKGMGVKVFDIVDYNVPSYNMTTSWDKFNSDGIIHVNSTSFGSYNVPLGQTLPEDYVQDNTYCTDPSHNHISPYNTLDASAGFLCETTWYVHGQHHEGTGRNDIIMNLTFELLLYDSITDVHADPRYPQFMDGRESRHLRHTLLTQAYALKAEGNLSAEELAKLNTAIADAEELLSRGTDSFDRFKEVEKNLSDVLVELGVREPAKSESLMDKVLLFFFKGLSDLFLKTTGGSGFSEMK